jgi:hypothetical protein
MAQFKDVTLVGGEKATINVDHVRAMQRFEKSTTIYFSTKHM